VNDNFFSGGVDYVKEIIFIEDLGCLIWIENEFKLVIGSQFYGKAVVCFHLV